MSRLPILLPGRKRRKKKMDDEEWEKKDEEEEEGEDEEESDGDEREDHGEGDGVVGEVECGGHRPFILPLIWTINDFYPIMSLKVFNNLCNRYQILERISIRLPRKFEKCYSGRTANVGMYDAIFTAGLRLLLAKLYH